MQPLCGLWLRKSKDGKTYMSGIADAKRVQEFIDLIGDGSARIMVFRNERKETEKHPDYHVSIDVVESKNRSWGAKPKDKPKPPPSDDEVPF